MNMDEVRDLAPSDADTLPEAVRREGRRLDLRIDDVVTRAADTSNRVRKLELQLGRAPSPGAEVPPDPGPGPPPDVEVLARRIDAAENRLAVLELVGPDVEALKTVTSDLKRWLNETAKQLDDRIDGCVKHIADGVKLSQRADERMTKMEADRRLDHRIDDVVKQAGHALHRVRNLELAPSDPALVRRIEEIEGVIRTADGELVTDVLAGRVAVLAGAPSAKALVERLEQQADRIRHLESEVAGHRQRLHTVESRCGVRGQWDAAIELGGGPARGIYPWKPSRPGEAPPGTGPDRGAWSEETCARVRAALAGAAGEQAEDDLIAELQRSGWGRTGGPAAPKGGGAGSAGDRVRRLEERSTGPGGASSDVPAERGMTRIPPGARTDGRKRV